MTSYAADWLFDWEEPNPQVYKQTLCKQISHFLFVDPQSYSVDELERIVEKVQEIEMYCDSILECEEVYSGNSQDPRSEEMYLFKDMFGWNYISAEQMDDLLDYHGELEELL